jgi:hypothetical protein
MCACLLEVFTYRAVLYVIEVFSVLPIKHHRTKTNEPTTPFELFYNKKPSLLVFRVFDCPVVTNKYTTTTGNIKKSKINQRGAIFIGLDQKGWLLYLSGSRRITVSNDIAFDENDVSALSYDDTLLSDALPLRPVHTSTPITDTVMEKTGDVATTSPSLEEREIVSADYQEKITNKPIVRQHTYSQYMIHHALRGGTP